MYLCQNYHIISINKRIVSSLHYWCPDGQQRSCCAYPSTPHRLRQCGDKVLYINHVPRSGSNYRASTGGGFGTAPRYGMEGGYTDPTKALRSGRFACPALRAIVGLGVCETAPRFTLYPFLLARRRHTGTCGFLPTVLLEGELLTHFLCRFNNRFFTLRR